MKIEDLHKKLEVKFSIDDLPDPKGLSSITEQIYEQYKISLQHMFKMVHQRREEILMAFYAKYGCEPDQVCQIETRDDEGNLMWYSTLKSNRCSNCGENK